MSIRELHIIDTRADVLVKAPTAFLRTGSIALIPAFVKERLVSWAIVLLICSCCSRSLEVAALYALRDASRFARVWSTWNFAFSTANFYNTTHDSILEHVESKNVKVLTAALFEVEGGVGGVAGPEPTAPGCWRIKFALVTSCCVSESTVATCGLYFSRAASLAP